MNKVALCRTACGLNRPAVDEKRSLCVFVVVLEQQGRLDLYCIMYIQALLEVLIAENIRL